MTIKSTRTAFISGVGSPTGIGFATAKAFGALGYTVGITSTTDRIFDRAKELQAFNVEAFGIVADLTLSLDVERVVSEFLAKFSTLDVLVNNAGMACVSNYSENEDGASAITWLASPEASYITGQTIVIDGGNSLAEERGN